MIGSNRDLALIRCLLDSEIAALTRSADGAGERDRIWRRLLVLARERRAVSVALANREIEAANKIVDLSRWFSGNGALGDLLHRADRMPMEKSSHGP